ncbi:MAG: hypothetical protein IKB85_05800 [Bacteroidales bacterium]|nr:hypothetical protein [Bacteroidales bacterium]
MLDIIKDFFRTRKLRKYASTLPTGIIPLSEIRTANVVIDVEEAGFELLKSDIMAWGKASGIKVNIYFFDFRRLGKDELLLTTIDKTFIRKGLDWIGTPNIVKVSTLMEDKSDLFISMICNGDFPIEFMSKCVRARFKVGRYEFDGHAYDLVVSGSSNEDLRSDSRKIFAEITEFLAKIK